MSKKEYLIIRKRSEELQDALMLIDNYSEEVYQAMQKVIDEIDDLLYEESQEE